MKRPIKFRGRFIRDEVDNEYIAENEMLYGGYVEIDGKPHIVHQMAMGWIISEVKPDSIAQLVGFDEVGNEVYEGDIVIDEFGHEVAAKLFDNLEFGRVALKEDSDETTGFLREQSGVDNFAESGGGL